MSHKNYYPLKLFDNLNCYFWQGRGNNCNSYLLMDVLKGDRPHVIIDPGNILNEYREPCSEYLLSAMEENGFGVRDVGMIINTHFHSDHFSASKFIVEKNGEINPPFIAFPQKEKEFLRTKGKKYYGSTISLFEEIKPFVLLDEGILKLGKISLQVLHTPGHTPGSLCFYWPDTKVLFSGDVLFCGSIGRTDLPGGSLGELAQSIEKLSHLDITYLLPGHSTEYGSFIQIREKVKRNFEMVKMYF